MLPDALLPSALAQTVLFATVYGLYILQVCAWVGLWERRPISTLGLERRRAGRRFLRGALLAIGVYLALLAVLAALGMVDVRSQPSAGSSLAVAAAAVVAFGGWVVQGSAEELLYRGWLLPVVAARSRLWWGIAASSAVFALSHLVGNPFDAMLLFNLVLFGVFFALWALREGGLWGLIGWHVIVNWVSENLIVIGEGAGVGPLANGLALGLDETGPDLLTGGTIGLEASGLTSILLAVGIAVLARPPRAVSAV